MRGPRTQPRSFQASRVIFSADQTNLRRYFSTLGVAIAAGTLSLAGLFLKLQQELLVTQSTLEKITPTARDALLRRQEYLSVGTTILPWFVLVGFLGGAGLSVYGMVGWAKRQRIIDEREDIGLRKERFELLQLTDIEKADKLDRDAKESAIESSSVFPGAGQPDWADTRSEIAIIENGLVRKLREIYGPNDVLSSVALKASGQMFIVDAIVRSPGKSDSIIFELKYTPNTHTVSRRISGGLNQVVRAASVSTGRGVLIIIVPDDATPIQVEQWNDRARQMAAEYGSIVSVYVGRYSDFLALSADDFAVQLGLAAPKK